MKLKILKVKGTHWSYSLYWNTIKKVKKGYSLDDLYGTWKTNWTGATSKAENFEPKLIEGWNIVFWTKKLLKDPFEKSSRMQNRFHGMPLEELLKKQIEERKRTAERF